MEEETARLENPLEEETKEWNHPMIRTEDTRLIKTVRDSMQKGTRQITERVGW